MEKKLFSVYLTQHATLIFVPEPGVEDLIEAHDLHTLIGDTFAEFGENYKFRNRKTMQPLGTDASKIIIPKGAIF